MTDNRLLACDTASLYFRAYYGLRGTWATADGTPTNAVRGLADFLGTAIRRFSPTHVVCAWDVDWRPAWRVDLVPSYKAQRVGSHGGEDVPEDLAVQVPLVREFLAAAGIGVLGVENYEADDVLASCAAQFDGAVDIFTGDRDLLQLIDDDRGVRVLYNGGGMSRLHAWVEADVVAAHGVRPDQYVDYSLMRGDPSDGLPGLKGIGERTAAALLAQYGDLAAIQAAADSMTPRRRQGILDGADYLRAARRVVTCVADLPLPSDWDRLRRGPVGPEFEAVADRLGLGGEAEGLAVDLEG